MYILLFPYCRRMSAITHFTHMSIFRSKKSKSKSTKNTKKVDAKPGLYMMNIMPVVSKIEHHNMFA